MSQRLVIVGDALLDRDVTGSADRLGPEPFLAVGGFPELLQIGAEETLLCYDLTAAGWGVRFLEQGSPYTIPGWSGRTGGGGRPCTAATTC